MYQEELHCQDCDWLMDDGTSFEIIINEDTVITPRRLNLKHSLNCLGQGEHPLGSLTPSAPVRGYTPPLSEGDRACFECTLKKCIHEYSRKERPTHFMKHCKRYQIQGN